MSPRQTATSKEIFLGIDWGSTAIRLAYCRKVGAEWITQVICNAQSTSVQDNHRYEKGAFNGNINISGTGPVWNNDEIGVSSVQIPAKLILGGGKGVDEKNPLLAEVQRHEGDEEFERRCQDGLWLIAKALASQIQSLCDRNSYKVMDVGLSVPSHWTLDETDQYAALMRRAFKTIGDVNLTRPTERRGPAASKRARVGQAWSRVMDNVNFPSEIESIAHFICNSPGRTDMGFGDARNKFVLFLDFGGHSMNGCIFQVRREDNKEPVFFRVKEPFGIVGGTAQWEASVSEYCTGQIARGEYQLNGTTEAAAIRNGLLREFRKKVLLLDCNPAVEMNLEVDLGDNTVHSHGPLRIHITADDSSRWFYNAMMDSLLLANASIKDLMAMAKADDVDRDACVIVSGGSAKNKKVQAELEGFCDAAGLPPPEYIHEKSVEDGGFETFNIAKGTALATARKLSLKGFLGNGAAFGLQMKQGGKNPYDVWDDEAEVLLAPKARQVTHNRGKNIGSVENT
ncbi:hypothetical protein C8035_v008709 [Colletotrichum spinosum]|uniref:Actin-like ATPase domain-containing protein n=1 Tax=Colletotrichum spinosum TaxID=1347390 RepID=A0A4R8PRD7_9PEZI|nr:hypothetical protein C8035_v008709 [Colletotrichum spinosum]